MSQLNIYLPDGDDLKGRLDAAAKQLDTTPNALARMVVGEFLETYVHVVSEVEHMKRRSLDDLKLELQHRSAAIGDRRFEDPAEHDLVADDERGPSKSAREVFGRRSERGAVAR